MLSLANHFVHLVVLRSVQDPITIVLNTDSLKDFSDKFEYDLDAVVSHSFNNVN